LAPPWRTFALPLKSDALPLGKVSMIDQSKNPPWRTFALPLKSDALPLGKVSMIDQSKNLTFFGCFGSTLRKKVSL
jgi:hypothetical protein